MVSSPVLTKKAAAPTTAMKQTAMKKVQKPAKKVKAKGKATVMKRAQRPRMAKTVQMAGIENERLAEQEYASESQPQHEETPEEQEKKRIQALRQTKKASKQRRQVPRHDPKTGLIVETRGRWSNARLQAARERIEEEIAELKRRQVEALEKAKLNKHSKRNKNKPVVAITDYEIQQIREQRLAEIQSPHTAPHVKKFTHTRAAANLYKREPSMNPLPRRHMRRMLLQIYNVMKPDEGLDMLKPVMNSSHAHEDAVMGTSVMGALRGVSKRSAAALGLEGMEELVQHEAWVKVPVAVMGPEPPVQAAALRRRSSVHLAEAATAAAALKAEADGSATAPATDVSDGVGATAASASATVVAATTPAAAASVAASAGTAESPSATTRTTTTTTGTAATTTATIPTAPITVTAASVASPITPAAPTTVTGAPVAAPAAPTAVTAAPVAAPAAPTTVTAAPVAAPTAPTTVTAAPVAAPAAPAAVTASPVAAPTAPAAVTAAPAAAPAVPTTVTAAPAEAPAVPTTVTAASAATPAVSNTATAAPAAAPAVSNTATAAPAAAPAVPTTGSAAPVAAPNASAAMNAAPVAAPTAPTTVTAAPVAAPSAPTTGTPAPVAAPIEATPVMTMTAISTCPGFVTRHPHTGEYLIAPNLTDRMNPPRRMLNGRQLQRLDKARMEEGLLTVGFAHDGKSGLTHREIHKHQHRVSELNQAQRIGLGPTGVTLKPMNTAEADDSAIPVFSGSASSTISRRSTNVFRNKSQAASTTATTAGTGLKVQRWNPTQFSMKSPLSMHIAELSPAQTMQYVNFIRHKYFAPVQNQRRMRLEDGVVDVLRGWLKMRAMERLRCANVVARVGEKSSLSLDAVMAAEWIENGGEAQLLMTRRRLRKDQRGFLKSSQPAIDLTEIPFFAHDTVGDELFANGNVEVAGGSEQVTMEQLVSGGARTVEVTRPVTRYERHPELIPGGSKLFNGLDFSTMASTSRSKGVGLGPSGIGAVEASKRRKSIEAEKERQRQVKLAADAYTAERLANIQKRMKALETAGTESEVASKLNLGDNLVNMAKLRQIGSEVGEKAEESRLKRNLFVDTVLAQGSNKVTPKGSKSTEVTRTPGSAASESKSTTVSMITRGGSNTPTTPVANTKAGAKAKKSKVSMSSLLSSPATGKEEESTSDEDWDPETAKVRAEEEEEGATEEGSESEETDSEADFSDIDDSSDDEDGLTAQRMAARRRAAAAATATPAATEESPRHVVRTLSGAEVDINPRSAQQQKEEADFDVELDPLSGRRTMYAEATPLETIMEDEDEEKEAADMEMEEKEAADMEVEEPEEEDKAGAATASAGPMRRKAGTRKRLARSPPESPPLSPTMGPAGKKNARGRSFTLRQARNAKLVRKCAESAKKRRNTVKKWAVTLTQLSEKMKSVCKLETPVHQEAGNTTSKKAAAKTAAAKKAAAKAAAKQAATKAAAEMRYHTEVRKMISEELGEIEDYLREKQLAEEHLRNERLPRKATVERLCRMAGIVESVNKTALVYMQRWMQMELFDIVKAAYDVRDCCTTAAYRPQVTLRKVHVRYAIDALKKKTTLNHAEARFI